MDDGGLRRGLRRRVRGGGGPPRQPPRAGAARGGGAAAAGGRGLARAGYGGRGGGRAGYGGRGGGRAGNGGGRGGARAGNGGGRGQLQGQRRVRAPAPPSLRDWLRNSLFVNLNGMTFEELEVELEEFLRGNPRINQKELVVHSVPPNQLDQGEAIIRLLLESEDKYRKMGLTRMILLKLYLKGGYNTPAAKYWRKNLSKQEKQLDETILELQIANARHCHIPDIFLSSPTLLPKAKH